MPTLNGKAKLEIPEATQSGKVFRLRGKGIKPVRGGAVGDLLCQVNVEIPVKLDKRQKELLREFGETLGERHNPETTTWLDKVKKLFEETLNG